VCSFAFIVFLVFLYAYLYAALRRRLHYRRNLQNHFANLDQRALDWLQLMLIILAIGWAWSAFSSVWLFSGTQPGWIGIVTALVQLGFTSAFALCAIIQPPIHLPESMEEASAPYSN